MKINYLLITSAAIILLSSCSRNMYVTNTVNVPLLKEAGEVKINVDQNDAQLAVGLTKHWGVMMNAFYKDYESDQNYTHEGMLGELGLGYFKPTKSNIIMEAYAGIGMGTIHKKQSYTDNDQSIYWASFNAQGFKAFLQPSIGYSTRFFDFAFTPRVSVVKYTHFSSFAYTDAQLSEDYLENERLTKSTFIFGEPAFTVRAGYKFVKIQAQYGLTVKMNPDKIKYNPSFGSVGIVIDIAKWYNKLQPEPGTK